MSILIIMNNYFHDVATAVLLSAAVVMWVLGKQAERGSAQERAALAKFYPTLTKFAWGSLAWIVVGGIPRLIYFNTYDLGALRDDLMPAIAVKHIVEFAAIAVGVLLWRRVRRMIEENAGA